MEIWCNIPGISLNVILIYLHPVITAVLGRPEHQNCKVSNLKEIRLWLGGGGGNGGGGGGGYSGVVGGGGGDANGGGGGGLAASDN
jgi:hypothetical protein